MKSRKGDNVPEQQEFDLGGPPGESFEDGQLTEEQANDLAQVLTSIPGFPNYRQVVRFGAKFLMRVCNQPPYDDVKEPGTPACRAAWLIDRATCFGKWKDWNELEAIYNHRFRAAGCYRRLADFQRPALCPKCNNTGVMELEGGARRESCDCTYRASAEYLAEAQRSLDASREVNGAKLRRRSEGDIPAIHCSKCSDTGLWIVKLGKNRTKAQRCDCAKGQEVTPDRLALAQERVRPKGSLWTATDSTVTKLEALGCGKARARGAGRAR